MADAGCQPVADDVAMTERVFRYHPDPIATGSAVPERHVCGVCGVQREVRYTGPVYGRQLSSLCLHGIASGRAAQGARQHRRRRRSRP
jgi:uncharacterized protein CbrC (UPF0167 family)